MKSLNELLWNYDSRFQEPLSRLRDAPSMTLMVVAAWALVRILAIVLLEEVLAVRAQQKQEWPVCPVCGQKMQSKGFRKREVGTLFGVIRWSRRVGRCPRGCKGVQVAPLDIDLGILAYQQTTTEVQSLGCQLSVFMAYETACHMLKQLTGVTLVPSTLWSWVGQAGQRAMEQMNTELQGMAAGGSPKAEPLATGLDRAPLLIGADGVMVPFRPEAGTPKGKTRWREVKVAILARLGERVNRKGERSTRLYQRRLVAVLGSIDDLSPRLWLEAVRQQVRSAVRVVWLSDGGTGFWSVFQRNFQAVGATPILDFYHAAQNLHKGAAAWLDGRTRACQQWFTKMRHDLRHGQEQQVLTELADLVKTKSLPKSALKTLTNLYNYLKAHEDHIHYDQFKTSGLPIGSGLAESACKWLIQQRFKRVGMRWSESGFNRLIHLRLAWVNQRFDNFFPDAALSPN